MAAAESSEYEVSSAGDPDASVITGVGVSGDRLIKQTLL